MKHANSNRKQQVLKLASIGVSQKSSSATSIKSVMNNGSAANVKAAANSLKTLAVQIERVRAHAVAADRGKFAAQVEAAKKALPSGTYAVMAGPKKRSATR